MTDEDLKTHARAVVQQIVEGWTASGRPIEPLAEAMAATGLALIANEHGDAAAAELASTISNEIAANATTPGRRQ